MHWAIWLYKSVLKGNMAYLFLSTMLKWNCFVSSKIIPQLSWPFIIYKRQIIIKSCMVITNCMIVWFNIRCSYYVASHVQKNLYTSWDKRIHIIHVVNGKNFNASISRKAQHVMLLGKGLLKLTETYLSHIYFVYFFEHNSKSGTLNTNSCVKIIKKKVIR